MEKGYVSSIKVYTNLGNMEVFIIPDSAKYIFPDVALQPLSRPMLTVGVGSIENLENFIKESKENGTFTGDYDFVPKSHTFGDIIMGLFPFILLIVLWVVMSRRLSGGAGGGAGGVFSVGKSKAKIYEKGQANRVTFKDVADRLKPKPKSERLSNS